MAYSSDKKTESLDQDTLKKLEDNFQSALDHPTWRDWRKHAAKCHDYKENKQWTDAELAELAKRGQPPTVNNQISVTINRMVGQFVRQATRVIYKGRNPQDQPGAEVLSDLFRFIRQSNDLEFEEKDQAEDGFTGGFGVLKASVTYDDTFQPHIEMKCVDSFTVLPDPYSRRYDWNIDANFICEAYWVDPEELKKLHPDKAGAISQIMDSGAGLGQLGDVDRQQPLYRLDFDDHGRLDKHVQPIPCVEFQPIIAHWQSYLPFTGKTCLGELMGQARLIRTFQ